MSVSIPSTPGPYVSELLEPYQFPHVYDYPDNTDAEFDDVSSVMSSEHRILSSSPGRSYSASATADSENICGGGPGRFCPLGPPTLAVPGNHGVTSFQPLFNFDFGFSTSTIGKAGCAAPPFLKRAFSWESNNGTEERPSCDDQAENLVNGTVSPCTQPLPSVTQKAPIQDFLFDAYLSTTNSSNTSEQQNGKNNNANVEIKEQEQEQSSSEQQKC